MALLDSFAAPIIREILVALGFKTAHRGGAGSGIARRIVDPERRFRKAQARRRRRRR
jgi:hypothetical protein